MFFQRYHSSISDKLLVSFLSIVLLALASLALTLSALQKTREAQNRLTQKALPLLQVSRSFSQSLFEYLTLLERVAIVQPEQLNLPKEISDHQKEIEFNINSLLELNQGAIEITPIVTLLKQIFLNANELQFLVFDQRQNYIRLVEDQMADARQSSEDIRRLLRRYRIISYVSQAEKPQYILSINNELTNIDQILAQYHHRIQADELKLFHLRYIVAVRKITQQVLQLKEPKFRQKIAKSASQLFDHTIDDEGFFSQSLNLNKNLYKTSNIIEDNKRKEQEVNLLLGKFLEDVGKKTDEELSTFDHLIKKNIIVVVAIIIMTIVAFIFIFYLYIVPKITRRLSRLASDTQRIAMEQYDTNINTEGSDEISKMAKALDGFKISLIAKEKTELEREKLMNQLARSNEELQRFAFVCSHDLQEPLRMIRSFSEKLKIHMGEHFEFDEKGKKYFRFVVEGAERAQNLIHDILAYSSIDSDAQALEQVDCNEIVRTIKENMHLYLEERQGKITLDKLPRVKGNKTQLFQLFQNLINNGVKYQTPDNEPHVHIGIEDKNEFWLFSVKDNGIGIESHHLKKIFEVFKRLHGKSQYAGTGVGLSICKKVIERHGGEIWAESDKGIGSVFYFTFFKNE